MKTTYLESAKAWIGAIWDWVLASMTSPMHEFRIRLLQLKKHHTSRKYLPSIETARTEKNDDYWDHIIDQHLSEQGELDDRIKTLNSEHWRSLAERLSLPIPELTKQSPDWERDLLTRMFRLSDEGLAKVRAAVRAEQRERREALKFWSTLIWGGITGLIGVLGSLIAYRAVN